MNGYGNKCVLAVALCMMCGYAFAAKGNAGNDNAAWRRADAALQNFYIHESPSSTFNARSFNSLQTIEIDCDPGDQATGGGYALEATGFAYADIGKFVFYENSPITKVLEGQDTGAWSVSVAVGTTPLSYNVVFKGYVVCAELSR